MSILGIIAALSTLCCIGLGLTSQIRTNYRRRSCQGLSLPLFALVFVAYLSWTIYGVERRDWFLIVSQTPGWILAGVILVQFYIYRRPLTLADAAFGLRGRAREERLKIMRR